MAALLLLLTAMLISIATIACLRGLAPVLGLVDVPDWRKIHSRPVARVGGWGIVAGTMVPLALLAPFAPPLTGFVAGVLVLHAFGTVDDRYDIGHYQKLVGQILAAAALVYLGDLWIERVPLLDAPLPPGLGRPFTVFAIVGAINALNHSDGLDGLAGGHAALSLLAIGALGYLEWLRAPAGASGSGVLEGTLVVLMVPLALGALLGFLRFNAHPARVFMGDTGSQFLGFLLAFLVIALTQRVDRTLSPAVVLLLLGVPVMDILAVLYLRIRGGSDWFRGTRNHIHHRLLNLGFGHRQAVVILYGVQTALVASALLACRAGDGVAFALYLGAAGLVFAALTLAERRGWSLASPDALGRSLPWAGAVRSAGRSAPMTVLAVALPGYMVLQSVRAGPIPLDVAVLTGALGVVLAFETLVRRRRRSAAVRLAVYVPAVGAVYLAGMTRLGQVHATAETVFFTALAGTALLAERRAREFRPTTTDYLLVLIAASAGLVALAAGERMAGLDVLSDAGVVAVRIAVALYCCELLLGQPGRHSTPLLLAAALALASFTAHGLWAAA